MRTLHGLAHAGHTRVRRAHQKRCAVRTLPGLKANWASPADVKTAFAKASILKDGRVVFNIAGNKYRLVVWINYTYRVVYIRFIGTHAQYDQIDAQTI